MLHQTIVRHDLTLLVSTNMKVEVLNGGGEGLGICLGVRGPINGLCMEFFQSKDVKFYGMFYAWNNYFNVLLAQ